MQLQEVFSVYRRPALLVTHNIEEAYRLGERLLVSVAWTNGCVRSERGCFSASAHARGGASYRLQEFFAREDEFRRQRGGIDWRCRLRVDQTISKPPAYVGIRAHYIDFLESAPANTARENVFPCWLVRASETPFRITLYLRLHDPNGEEGTFDLQAEVFKEKWQRFRDAPCPWHVRLSPESLFVTPE